jgi:hypothetical protein
VYADSHVVKSQFARLCPPIFFVAGSSAGFLFLALLLNEFSPPRVNDCYTNYSSTPPNSHFLCRKYVPQSTFAFFSNRGFGVLPYFPARCAERALLLILVQRVLFAGEYNSWIWMSNGTSTSPSLVSVEYIFARIALTII